MAIRLVLFKDRPHTMMVFVPEDDNEHFTLPELQSPFTAGTLGEALTKAGVREHFRIDTLPHATAYNEVIRKQLHDERSERAQRANLARSVAAQVQKSSNNPSERERAELVEQKSAVDADLRKSKIRLGEVKAMAATTGRYIKPTEFRKLEETIARLTTRSQALQVSIGEVSRDIKRQNIKSNSNVLQLFKDIASRKLPLELFREILAEALAENDRVQSA